LAQISFILGPKSGKNHWIGIHAIHMIMMM